MTFLKKWYAIFALLSPLSSKRKREKEGKRERERERERGDKNGTSCN